MKSSTKQLLIGVGGAVAAGLILQRISGRSGGMNPEFVSGAPYGNSIAAKEAVMASAGGSSRSRTSSSKVAGASSGVRPIINFFNPPTYKGKSPYAWGYGTQNIDGGGALI